MNNFPSVNKRYLFLDSQINKVSKQSLIFFLFQSQSIGCKLMNERDEVQLTGKFINVGQSKQLCVEAQTFCGFDEFLN